MTGGTEVTRAWYQDALDGRVVGEADISRHLMGWCLAPRKAGGQCQRRALRGSTLCQQHRRIGEAMCEEKRGAGQLVEMAAVEEVFLVEIDRVSRAAEALEMRGDGIGARRIRRGRRAMLWRMLTEVRRVAAGGRDAD